MQRLCSVGEKGPANIVKTAIGRHNNIMETSIHIIGAGIAGLTLALGLLRQGLKIKIYEHANALGEVGAGLSISPNASKGLAYLDMSNFMETQSNTPQTNYVFHGATDEKLVAIDRKDDVRKFGAKYYQIHRSDFHAELVKRVLSLAPDAIELGHQLTSVEDNPEYTKLVFANGKTVKAETTIGADGIKSRVRDDVFGDCEPEFTGLMAWRGLITADQVPDIFTQAVSRVWTGPGRTFVTYPIRGTSLINVVAMGKASKWREEGWSVKANPQELLATFQDWCQPVQTLINAIPAQDLFRWGLFSRRPLPSLISGNVALIGDAAHPMLPWFGQGASSSIEDGIVFARCFEQADNAHKALKLYDKARHERVTFLQRESNLGTERMQGMDPYSLRDAPRRDEDALGIFKYNPAAVTLSA